MPAIVAGLYLIITVATSNQAKAQQPASKLQTEDDRVRAIVEKLAGPTISNEPRRSPTPIKNPQILVEEVVANDLQPLEEAEEDPDKTKVIFEEPIDNAATFDFWVFGQKTSEKSRKEWLNSILRGRLISNGVRYHLTTDELTKLHLAGKGDIARLFSKIESQRHKYTGEIVDIRRAKKLRDEISLLTDTFRNGPFRTNSLFYKTLTKIIDDREKSQVRNI